jgi:hypothetical protein
MGGDNNTEQGGGETDVSSVGSETKFRMRGKK